MEDVKPELLELRKLAKSLSQSLDTLSETLYKEGKITLQDHLEVHHNYLSSVLAPILLEKSKPTAGKKRVDSRIKSK